MTQKAECDSLKIKNEAAWYVSQISKGERDALLEDECCLPQGQATYDDGGAA